MCASKRKAPIFHGACSRFPKPWHTYPTARLFHGRGRLGASDNKYRANRVQISNPLKSGRVRYFSLLPETGNVLTIFFRSNRRARFLNLKTYFKNFSPFVLNHKFVTWFASTQSSFSSSSRSSQINKRAACILASVEVNSASLFARCSA